MLISAETSSRSCAEVCLVIVSGRRGGGGRVNGMVTVHGGGGLCKDGLIHSDGNWVGEGSRTVWRRKLRDQGRRTWPD